MLMRNNSAIKRLESSNKGFVVQEEICSAFCGCVYLYIARGARRNTGMHLIPSSSLLSGLAIIAHKQHQSGEEELSCVHMQACFGVDQRLPQHHTALLPVRTEAAAAAADPAEITVRSCRITDLLPVLSQGESVKYFLDNLDKLGDPVSCF